MNEVMQHAAAGAGESAATAVELSERAGALRATLDALTLEDFVLDGAEPAMMPPAPRRLAVPVAAQRVVRR